MKYIKTGKRYYNSLYYHVEGKAILDAKNIRKINK